MKTPLLLIVLLLYVLTATAQIRKPARNRPGEDKFSIKKLSGYSVQFEVNDKGEATTLTAMQPNGNYKATRKTAATVAEKKTNQ